MKAQFGLSAALLPVAGLGVIRPCLITSACARRYLAPAVAVREGEKGELMDEESNSVGRTPLSRRSMLRGLAAVGGISAVKGAT